MLRMINGYKRFPFRIRNRVKFYNIFRYFFSFPVTEKFLVKQILHGNSVWWKKLIPPLYFYEPGSVRDVERDGIRYHLDISRMLDHSTYFSNIVDPAWSRLFTFIKKDSVILDAGANIGYLTLYFAGHCPEGMVYSFEPDSQNFEDLSRNVRLNSFSNVKLFKKALGEAPGNLTLYKLYEANPGANRILSAPPAGDVKHEVVEVTTLDQLYAAGTFQKIDLMKIDVEGFELFLLRGAQQLIKAWKPVLFVELAEVNLKMQNCTAASLVQFIEDLGYNVLDAKTMVVADKANLAYTDILCFPK